MTDLDLESLRGLRREQTTVPSAARERGRRRLEELLTGPPRHPPAERLARRTLARLPAATVVALALAAAVVLVVSRGPRDASRPSQPARAQAGATATLGVLRRPQNNAEQALVHRAATDRYAALPQFSDPGSVRILAPGVLGRDVFLYVKGDSVCVYYPDVEGGGITCAPTSKLGRQRMIGALGTEVYGLVPDGVSQVEVTFASGTVPIAVSNNFWQTNTRSATPSAIVWKASDGKEIDPADAPQHSARLAPAPPKVTVTRTELRAHVDVLSGHRVRFTPRPGGYRYEISLRCGRSGFDGAVTKPLPGGNAVTVALKLAAARDQCPGVHAFAGQIIELRPQDAHAPTRTGNGFRTHVTVLGHFELSR